MNDRGEGWILFAMIALITAGVMRLFDAIWIYNYHGSLPEGLQAGVFGQTIRNYAWTYLAVAVVFILAAFLLAARSQVARWVGMVAGGVGAVSAIWWMPFYPIWSLTYIAISILVIYALAVYGGSEAPSS
jgi:hypothetical protein